AGQYSNLCKSSYDKTKYETLNACGQQQTAAAIDACISKEIGTGVCTEFNKDKVAEDFSKNEEKWVCKDGNIKGLSGQAYFTQFGSHNAALILAVEMGQMLKLPDVDITAKDITTLAIGTVFSVLMYIVYVLSFIALGIVLLGRIVILWISVALSPVILILMAVPAVKEQAGGLKRISEEFVKNAIAPLIIAIPLSIGFIMITAVKNGMMAGGSENEVFGNTTFTGIPVAGMNTLESLIAMFGTLALVWIGVFEAAENTIAKGVTGAIKSFGQTVGGYIAQKPLEHFPLAPVKGMDGKNITLKDTVDVFRFGRLGHQGPSDNAKYMMNQMGLQAQTGSSNVSDMKHQSANEAVNTLARSGGLRETDKTKWEETRKTLGEMTPQNLDALYGEIGRRTGTDKGRIKQNLEAFMKGAEPSTELKGWMQNIQQNPENPAAATPATPATPKTPAEQAAAVKTAQSKFKKDSTSIVGGLSTESKTVVDSNFKADSNGVKSKDSGKLSALKTEAQGTGQAKWQQVGKELIGKIKADNPGVPFKAKELENIMGKELYDIVEAAMTQKGIEDELSKP
ncbi:MAG: hypothetical protein WC269_00960, partial [Candidatus Gracilibacteria bacterium]